MRRSGPFGPDAFGRDGSFGPDAFGPDAVAPDAIGPDAVAPARRTRRIVALLAVSLLSAAALAAVSCTPYVARNRPPAAPRPAEPRPPSAARPLPLRTDSVRVALVDSADAVDITILGERFHFEPADGGMIQLTRDVKRAAAGATRDGAGATRDGAGATRDGAGAKSTSATAESDAAATKRGSATAESDAVIRVSPPYELPGTDSVFVYNGHRYRGRATVRMDGGADGRVGARDTARDAARADTARADAARDAARADGRDGGRRRRSLTLVNTLALEDYLAGVVPLEIGSRSPELLEAVKAQAVAARTYAVGALGQYGDRGFDLYGSVQDQVYGGIDVRTPLADRAVQETAGEIMAADGAPARAYYHSTCGGQTARIEEVWTKPPASYLRGVVDRPAGASESDSYCKDAPNFRWEERWTAAELAPILARTLTAPAGHAIAVTPKTIEDIRIESTGASGRVKDVVIVVKGERVHVFGDGIRRVLRPAKNPGAILRSARFRLEVKKSGGHVSRVIAHGSGNGHGVGMCQVGALGMARHGTKWRDILEHYYPGVDLIGVSSLQNSGCAPGGVLLGFHRSMDDDIPNEPARDLSGVDPSGVDPSGVNQSGIDLSGVRNLSGVGAHTRSEIQTCNMTSR